MVGIQPFGVDNCKKRVVVIDNMLHIVADCDIPFLKGVLEPYARVEYKIGSDISSEQVRCADVLITRTRTNCNRDLLEGSSLSLITTATIGTDHIDDRFCRENSIEVFSAAGCNSRGVLQWVAAVLAAADVDPVKTKLGIVGVGNIGSLVRDYALNWGFDVLCCDKPRQNRGDGGFVSLEQIFKQCDIITFHTPLNKGGEYNTYHMVERELLGTMRDGAIIINSARGNILDTEALLESKARFVIDTWENEPQINAEALERSLLATPHIAGYSIQGKAMATAMCVRHIAQRYDLPLKNWYPSQVLPSVTSPISWEEMKKEIKNHFDIVVESTNLKSQPQRFEQIRNNYTYRSEFF